MVIISSLKIKRQKIADFAIQGIITFTAKRWVCLMDPQEIGKKWIQVAYIMEHHPDGLHRR